MESEGSLPFSQQSTNGPYPEPYASTPLQLHFPEIYSDIIFPPTPMSSEWSLPLAFSDQNSVFTS
jgi:hypothetical protein